MERISGYEFAINLDDRGMRRGFKVLKREARDLKAIMKANFEEVRSGEGVYSAFSNKILDAQNAIKGYEIAIEQMRHQQQGILKEIKLESAAVQQSGDKHDLAAKKKRTAYLKLDNTINSYRRTVSKLAREQQKAREAAERYVGNLKSMRIASENITRVGKSFADSLDAQGRHLEANKVRVRELKDAQEALKTQQVAEKDEASRLAEKTQRVSRAYDEQAQKVQRVKRILEENNAASRAAGGDFAKVKQTTASHQKLVEILQRENSKLLQMRDDVSKTSTAYSKQVSKVHEISGAIGRMRTQMNAIHPTGFTRMQKAVNGSLDKFNSFNSKIGGVARRAAGAIATVTAAATPALALGAKSAQLATQLQNDWVKTKNLLVTGSKSANEARRSVRDMAVMQRDAAKYSKEYGYSQHNVAKQYEELTKRGYSSRQSIGSMKAMLEAARASGDSYGDVVKNVSSAVDAFGLRTDNTRKMIENTKRATNAMAYAADMTATDFKNMGYGMSYVSATSKQAGYDIETTSAALGDLSNSGIEGQKAGTGLRKVLNSLISPTKNSVQALKKVGLSINDFKTKSGALKPLPKIMALINSHISKLGKADKGAFFKALFGTTGMQAGQVLSQSSKNLEKLIKQTRKAEQGSGYVHRLAQKNMATTQMQMKRLKMTIQDMGINLGKQLLPSINKVTLAFSRWTETAEGKGVIKGISNAIVDGAQLIAKYTPQILHFTSEVGKGFVDAAKNITGFGKSGHSMFGWLQPVLKQTTEFAYRHARAISRVITEYIAVTKVIKFFTPVIKGVGKLIDGIKWLYQQTQIRATTRAYEGELAVLKRIQKQLEVNNATASGADTTLTAEKEATQQAEEQLGNVGIKKGAEKTVAKGAENTAMKEAGKVASQSWLAGFLSKFKFGRALLKVRDFSSNIKSSLAKSLSKFNIFNKLTRGAKTSRFASFGKTIGGKIVGGIAVAVSAFDIGKSLVRTINSKKSHSRYRSAGESVAKTFGTGVGFILGGPGGAAIGEQLSGASYKWGTRSYHNYIAGWNAYGRNHKPKTFVAKVGYDFHNFYRKYNNAIAKIERRRPRVQAAFQFTRGSIKLAKESILSVFRTAKAGVHFMADTMHSSWSWMWAKVLGESKRKTHSIWSNWRKDTKKNGSNTWSSIKKGWGEVWDAYTKKRTEVYRKTDKDDDNRAKKRHRQATQEAKDNAKVVSSLGKAHYSKADIANVKSMNRAIKDYSSSLKKLKDSIHRNDPTKQLNGMNKRLVKSVGSWGKLAKPIKKIGDAFKTLASFSRSMNKKDPFAALNKDLPRLVTTMNKAKKTLPGDLKTLTNAFKGKSGSKKLSTYINDLDKVVKKANSHWKSFAGYISKVASSARTMRKAVAALTGKNGLKTLKNQLSSLDSKLKHQSIASRMTKLSSGIKRSKLKTQLSGLTKALGKNAKAWKVFSKAIKTVGSYLPKFAKAVKQLTGKKTGLNAMTSDIKKLKTAMSGKSSLGKEFSALASSIKKSGIVNQIKRLATNMKKFVGNVKKLKQINAALKSIETSLKRMENKKGKNVFDALNSSIIKLQKTLRGKNGFGDLIAKQVKKARNAMSGKSSFATKFDSETDKFMKTEKDFAKGFKSSWDKLWNHINKPVQKNFDKVEKTQSRENHQIEKAEDRHNDRMIKLEKSFISSYEKNWDKFLDSIDKNFEKGFDKLGKLAAKGMNGAIDAINSGTSKIDHVIADFGGSKSAIGRISHVHYATGTGMFSNVRRPITRPTLAMLNDGSDSPETGNQEAVLDKRTGDINVIQGTNVPKMLMPWHEVFNASETRALGLTRFASGTGFLQGLENWFSTKGKALKKWFNAAEKIIKSPTKVLTGLYQFNKEVYKSNAMEQLAHGFWNASKKQAKTWWSALWNMASDHLDGGSADGLLAAVEKYGNGHRYVWGAAGPTTFDCSGLVMYALKKAFGIDYPHFSGSQYSMSEHVSTPRKGDLVFFGPHGNTHVGVYAGHGDYYSAMSPSSRPNIGMSSVSSGPGEVHYARVRGLSGKQGKTSVKTKNALQSLIKREVGNGFFKFLDKLGDKFGIGAEGRFAGGVIPTGEHMKLLKKAGVPRSDWAAMNYIITHESSWNSGAWNPIRTSTGHAIGLGQLTEGNQFYVTKYGSASNPINQIKGMVDYIHDRYGSIANAANFWRANGSYANGGVVRNEQLARIGEDNKPESIIPWDFSKRARAYALTKEMLDNFAKTDAPQQRKDTQGEKNSELLTKAVQLLSTLVQQNNNPVPAVVSSDSVYNAVHSREKKKQLLNNLLN